MTAPRLTPTLLVGPGALLFLALVVLPLVLTFILSFHAFDHTAGVKNEFTLGHYWAVISDDYYLNIFWRTLRLALLTTVICALIGAPEAYILSRMRDPWRSIFLLVVLGPLLVSVVVRAFGWSMLLGGNGLVNQAIQALGFGPVKILYTETAIVIALVHVMLPFMVIPVWTALQKLDPTVEAAAWTLGASRFTTLRRVVLPQVTMGVLSGSLIVFGLSASSFAIPGLLGGRRLKMAATLVYDEYMHELNWPLGAAIAIIVLLANLLIMLSYNRVVEARARRTLG
ncbi:ABC transporter permease [Elstera cyanobacteriorum]|uniref:ABC transporter permease n=1 Tax=Elstera cyanobacteriorum TaxID=2022747 RepID=A0A255XR14_9PROT|nr:ABC transporter permease [Elstera cyanobacteriorum]MCK6442581.1 ABC transporter permease [Elstera cyanobacteriorum]OYQ19408.1 ABC transporter permease [Elstera cyanobacteriorum]GFZ91209.1 ABC transporter permease [Elstera cyanobacteriorum]